jgi:UPF0042 nucleotide-binding protein
VSSQPTTETPDGAREAEASGQGRVDAGTGPAPELLIVTGMSGAGRTTTGNVLEDLGWFVVDNLPPQMMGPLAVLAAKVGSSLPRLAVVVDVRGRSFFTEIRDALEGLRDSGIRLRVLFLDASDEVLVRRFESVRRPHPLQGDGRILDGIERERELVGDLRATADLVVDTTDLNVHQLSSKILQLFSEEGPARLRVTVMSFGFKYGIPVDADHVVDVRFLPNPFWVSELRPLTGREGPVSEYVLTQPGAVDFIERYVFALEPVMSGYLRENRSYATIALGCTGGKHRSVAMAEEIAARLRATGVNANAVHRDLGRE